MKKVFLCLSLLLTLSLAFLVLKNNFLEDNFEEENSSQVLGLPDEKKETVRVGEKYQASWYEVADDQTIFLYPNKNKDVSHDFLKENECTFLSSAGYYKTDFSPTGLLISEYKELSPFVSSSLSDAIFSINDFEIPRITSSLPQDRSRVALQAGPMLKENARKRKLSLIRDEEARRVVLGVTGENKAVFIIFYNPDSAYLGPNLKDLPDLLEEFENKSGVVLADAMNLDGGGAGAFVKAGLNLPEAEFVGSFFCVR